MRLNLIIICLLLSATAQASQVVIDFDTFEVAGDGVVSNGFELDLGFVNSFPALLEGSFTWQPTFTTTLTQVGGASFGLLSLDLNIGDLFGAADAFQLIGHLEGGGTIETSFSQPPDSVWNTHSLGSEWNNLTAVEITSPDGFHAIDNLVVTAVPIPAAVWLFGSALAGLGWMRRRHTV